MRPVIYQTFPRILTNTNDTNRFAGTLEENGSGKLADYTPVLLRSLKAMGVNCIWLTGVIEHATKSDFSAYGIESDNPNVVKGEAGSPYAIRDYYDIDPAIAVDPAERMKEFEDCVRRIHAQDMKVLIDFVPNHTARRYHSDAAPAGIKDFGADDDTTLFFGRNNNYYYITNQQFSPTFDIAAEGTEPYLEFPAKATGNDCFNAFCGVNDWYETVKLNYGHDYGNGSDH
ncbi:MAG: alpha-amylase, partial [Muribaculaceae bacterium]|nr:alpha-amylase [Muribaculaceae bacterium]